MRARERRHMEVMALGTFLASQGRDIEPSVPACIRCGGHTARVDRRLRRCDRGHVTAVVFTQVGTGGVYVEWKTVAPESEETTDERIISRRVSGVSSSHPVAPAGADDAAGRTDGDVARRGSAVPALPPAVLTSTPSDLPERILAALHRCNGGPAWGMSVGALIAELTCDPVALERTLADMRSRRAVTTVIRLGRVLFYVIPSSDSTTPE